MKKIKIFLILLIAITYSCSSEVQENNSDNNKNLLENELKKEITIIQIEDTYSLILDVHGNIIIPGYYVMYKNKPLERIELGGHTENYFQLKSGNMQAKAKWVKKKKLTVQTKSSIKSFGIIVECKVLCLEGINLEIYREEKPIFNQARESGLFLFEKITTISIVKLRLQISALLNTNNKK